MTKALAQTLPCVFAALAREIKSPDYWESTQMSTEVVIQEYGLVDVQRLQVCYPAAWSAFVTGTGRGTRYAGIATQKGTFEM
jgi:hypothetical protein